MKCPKCGEELLAHFTPYQAKDKDYVEVEFTCVNNHIHFVRIKEEDLIEAV